MSPSQNQPKHVPHTNPQILLFVVLLCLVSALLLSIVAYTLSRPQEEAKEFDRSRQMLIAAKILNYSNEFLILNESNETLLAKFDPDQKILVPVEEGENTPKATDDQIKLISELRIRPLMTDAKGKVYTLESLGLDLAQYLSDNKKTGYANLPNKLFYAILPNKPGVGDITAEELAEKLDESVAYVFPVSGFGLWAPIYGYIAIADNGDDVIGTTWYEMAETPGLGANIAEPGWQKQFFNKLIFQEGAGGKTDFKTASMGIVVVKGTVQDAFGTSTRAKSAVDGISGATLTGNGVTAAYKDSLSPYRQLLINIHSHDKEGNSE